MKKLFALIIVFCTAITTYAQLRTEALEDAVAIDSLSVNKLQLNYNHINFFKNNEYFNNIVYGYTLFGTLLNPQLSFTATKNLRIEGGVFLRKDFGTNGFKLIAPTLSVRLEKNGYAWIFGNLDGSLNHRLIEPLYDYERLINNKLETGVQFKIDKKKIWIDTWVDWEKQIYQNSPFQESIAGGLSALIKPFNTGEKISIGLPIQATVSHLGGQIDIDTNAIQTLTNTATGFTIDWKSNDGGFIKKVSLQNYYSYFKDHSNIHKLAYISGDGYYANLLIESKFGFSLLTSYWRGEYFLAKRGGYLYQSSSSVAGSTFTEDNRELIIVRFLYQKQIMPGLYTDIRFEPFYDLRNKKAEYSYSVYLTYRNFFDLFERKKASTN